MKYSAIVLSAGKGTRFGGKKQDIVVNGKPLWKMVYDAAIKVVGSDRTVVVGKDILGGKTRSESVTIGLDNIPKDTEKVIILEAARPLVTEEQIRILLNDRHASVSFVRPLVNTVIYRDGRYINREDLYDLLTPQAFDYQKLVNAYKTGKYTNTTDETRVMYEEYGISPFFIETGNNLLKVTYPGDIEIIEALLKKQLEGKE